MIPTTGIPKRIATLFSRRLTTAWSEKEIKAYKAAVKGCDLVTLGNDLVTIERYYKSERKKGDKGIHRRDLLTFLNNFGGELDRATEWSKTHSHNGQSSRTRFFQAPVDRRTPEQVEADCAKAKAVFEELKNKLRMSNNLVDNPIG